jgi:DNA-binding SARP family transcriptional activator
VSGDAYHFGRLGEAMLRIHLLGTMTVWRADGSQVRGSLWRRSKVRALLILFVLQKHQGIHRRSLIATLWPTLPRSAALRNLNTTIYNLRQSLEPSIQQGSDSRYLRYAGHGYYAFCPDAGYWLDVDAFEANICQARQETNTARAMVHYRRACELYRGDFLADQDLVREQFTDETRRLRDLQLAAMEELASLYEETGFVDQAYQLYATIMTLNPCREKACQRLMQLALAHEDRISAVTYYRRLARALDSTLALDPSDETRLIYESAKRTG